MITLWDSIRLKKYNHPLQHTKQHQRKLQPSSLLLNRKSGNRTKLVLMWCSHEKIQGTFHYQEVPLGMLFRALHKKVPWNKWNFVFPLEIVRWKSMFYLRVLIRNHQFKAIHGDICGTILKFGDESINEWNLCQMEHVLHSMDLSTPVSENFW